MNQGHECRKRQRNCLCVPVCVCYLTPESRGKEKEKRQRESPGSWGLALLPLEMLCILLIRAWVALKLAEDGCGWIEVKIPEPIRCCLPFAHTGTSLSPWRASASLRMSLHVSRSSLNHLPFPHQASQSSTALLFL